MTLREAVEYLHWEGLSPKRIMLEIQKRSAVGHTDVSTLTEERVIELINDMEGIPNDD